jgi:hypothetical protein
MHQSLKGLHRRAGPTGIVEKMLPPDTLIAAWQRRYFAFPE